MLLLFSHLHFISIPAWIPCLFLSCAQAEMNPAGEVPVIQEEDGFVLSDSHSIMRYLCLSRPDDVDHHWYYGLDLRQRAQVDMEMDHQHTILRRGAAPYAFGKAMGPLGGLPVDENATTLGMKHLNHALKVMERKMEFREATLEGGGSPWLAGTEEPTLADLSTAVEVGQLEVLGEFEEILGIAPRFKSWYHRFVDYAGEDWAKSHELFYKVVEIAREQGM